MSKLSVVVGGTDGLGFEIAKLLRDRGDDVVAVGRNAARIQEESGMRFVPLDIGTDIPVLAEGIDTLLSSLQGASVDTLVYAPGFNQLGRLDELSDDSIILQLNVTMTAFAFLMKRIFLSEETLPNLLVITSTTQIRPREFEPMYAGTKAGLAHLAHSIATDTRGKIGKTLVVLPSGMDTKLLKERGVDPKGLLDPAWVALETLAYFDAQTALYEECLILREPARVEKRTLPF